MPGDSSSGQAPYAQLRPTWAMPGDGSSGQIKMCIRDRPNVVQAHAESRYLVRSTTNPKCEKLYDRVKRIAQGAALMTDTELEIVFDEGLSNTVPNFVLEDVMAQAFRELGVPEYTPQEREYAQRFKDTFPIEGTLSDLPSSALDRDALVRNVRELSLIHI